MSKPDTCTEYLRYEFESKEIQEMGKDLANQYNKKAQIEEEEASMKAAVKDSKTRIEQEIGRLSRLISAQFEMRNVQCRLLWHSPAPGFVTIIRCDTGEVIKERIMTFEERQELLPFPDKHTREIPKPEKVRGALAEVGEDIPLAEVAKWGDTDLCLVLEWAEALKKWIEYQNAAMADPTKEAGEGPATKDKPMILLEDVDRAYLVDLLAAFRMPIPAQVVENWTKAEALSVVRWISAIIDNEKRSPTEEATQPPTRPECIKDYKRMDPEPPQADAAGA